MKNICQRIATFAASLVLVVMLSFMLVACGSNNGNKKDKDNHIVVEPNMSGYLNNLITSNYTTSVVARSANFKTKVINLFDALIEEIKGLLEDDGNDTSDGAMNGGSVQTDNLTGIIEQIDAVVETLKEYITDATWSMSGFKINVDINANISISLVAIDNFKNEADAKAGEKQYQELLEVLTAQLDEVDGALEEYGVNFDIEALKNIEVVRDGNIVIMGDEDGMEVATKVSKKTSPIATSMIAYFTKMTATNCDVVNSYSISSEMMEFVMNMVEDYLGDDEDDEFAEYSEMIDAALTIVADVQWAMVGAELNVDALIGLYQMAMDMAYEDSDMSLVAIKESLGAMAAVVAFNTEDNAKNLETMLNNALAGLKQDIIDHRSTAPSAAEYQAALDLVNSFKVARNGGILMIGEQNTINALTK